MGEGEAYIYAAWWGNSSVAGEGDFLQPKVGARVLTQSRELPVTVSVAAGGLGGGRRGVRLSACISMGFSWAQFSGVMAEVSTLKTVSKRTSGSGCPYEIVALFHSHCCSSWT